MAWNPQGGGPWGGGGGPRGGGGQPPNLEDLVRNTQDRFRNLFPKGGFKSGRGLVLIILAALLLWLATGFYRVQPGEEGVELLFGEHVSSQPAGLHWWYPTPIGTVLKPDVAKVNVITVGYQGGSDRADTKRKVLQESLMLTGDQNIVDLEFQVQWQIGDASKFLFEIRNPEGTIKAASESVMREVVGRSMLEDILSQNRALTQENAKKSLQDVLDYYQTGVFVTDLKLQTAEPPAEVIDAFNDVQRAKQDQERLVNEAAKYANEIVPRAQGQAEKMTAQANAYKEQVVNEAQGEAQRFVEVYESYAQNKDVTSRRLYLERMEEVLRKSNKVIIDEQSDGQGVVPYLPLNELMRGRKTQ